MPRLPYREGDWFAVPLASGGYAVGLVARCSRQGKILLGYFFGPRRAELPELSDLLQLAPADAVLVDLFGDLFLYRRQWPILGSTPDWDHGRWPMPIFGAVDELTGIGWRIEYPDEDPTADPRRTRVSGAEASRLPEDRLRGAGAVAKQLDQQLP
jgi:Immunity protein 26